jgi:xylulokinase
MPARTDHILAIDLGSSGPKVSLVAETGEIAASASARTATIHTPDGGGEQDPAGWWAAIERCVRAVVGERRVPAEQIVAVSCASQWSVTVPVDREGRHLMNAIHWSDMRGAAHTRPLIDGPIKVAGYAPWALAQWIRLTGAAPTHSGNDALAHMLFIQHERPDVYRQTYKLLEPMDYINFRLTGRAAATYATVYPYLLTDNRDNTRIRYADTLLRRSGLDPGKLPELIPVCQVQGTLRPEIAEAWGLSPATQVIAGTPDSQAAALGSGAVTDFAGHICLGTTAWLSCHVPFKKTNIFNYVATMPSALPGRNMVMAEQGAAGKCLESFVDNWLLRDDALSQGAAPDDLHARIEQLAGGVPAGSEGLLFLPWLGGAGPPTGDAQMRGGFLNQSLTTTRAHALRAIMEGVACNLRWLRGAVERFIGRPFDTLNFIGGGARSDLRCQITADVLGCPLRRMREPEMAIARGAAMVAWIALGRMQPGDVGSMARPDRTFEPDPGNRAVYNELFAAFLASYKANRGLFHRLNDPRRLST